MVYRVHLAWAGFELALLVGIGTDCTLSCKSNYHTTTTAPKNFKEITRVECILTSLLQYSESIVCMMSRYLLPFFHVCHVTLSVSLCNRPVTLLLEKCVIHDFIAILFIFLLMFKTNMFHITLALRRFKLSLIAKRCQGSVVISLFSNMTL
jgi:hypothetical protein